MRRFSGSFTALPSFFRDDGLDLETFDGEIERQVEGGSAGVVVCGTTGEAATLSEAEQDTLIARAVERAAGRLAVLAGTGTNDTQKTVARCRRAAELGVDACLVVTPYYNRPSPAGLLAHFDRVAEESALPIVLYNIPGRTGVDLTPDLALALAARHPNVRTIKEASGSVERVSELATGLDVLIGEDPLIAAAMRAGAAGVVGVLSNLVPGEVAELVRVGGPDGNPKRAMTLEALLAPLCRALFLESNPVPVKEALALLGRGDGSVRLPLAPLSLIHREELERVLEAGLPASV